jgi:23S rRNA (adenine-N6)-dimethyltransferase
MAKKPNKRITLAQNFLRSSKLVRQLVNSSSIGPVDTVYEIGPGRGIITAELARTAYKVIAIEHDPQLVRQLDEKFRHVHNVVIIENDFLQYPIQDREYKIFANIRTECRLCTSTYQKTSFATHPRGEHSPLP